MIAWYESIMSYWRRRAYERIGTSEPSDPSKRSRSTRLIRLRRLQLRQRTRAAAAVVVTTPLARLRLKALSPFRLLARLKNVYIDAMLRMTVAAGTSSSHQVTTTTPQGVWIGRIPSARRSASAKSSRLERRMILNLYNSLVANPELLHGEPKQLVQ